MQHIAHIANVQESIFPVRKTNADTTMLIAIQVAQLRIRINTEREAEWCARGIRELKGPAVKKMNAILSNGPWPPVGC